MADQLQTIKIPCRGGLDTNLDTLQQGDTKPGSAIRLINYESSLSGGYRRVSGFSLYDADHPSPAGTGAILGVCVFDSIGIVVARKPSSGTNYIYKYSSGWSAINTHTPTFTGVTKVRFVKYNWTRDKIAVLDGVNRLQTYNGTTWTDVNTTNAPVAPKYGTEFNNRLFVTKGDSILKFSAPLDDTKWQSADGAGEINVGFPIVALKSFRDSLYIFGRNRIKKLTGNASANFAVSPVTTNLGCIAPDSVIEVAGDLYFLGPDGIRPIAGTARVGDVELETVSKPIQLLLERVPNLYNVEDISSVVIRGKSQFRYFFSDGTASGGDSYGIVGCLRLTEEGIGWEFGELFGIGATCADSDYIGAEEYVIHGSASGEIFRQESGNSFNGENVFSLYQSPWLDFQDTPLRKVPHKLWMFTRSEGLMNIKISFTYNWEDLYTTNPGNYQLTSSGVIALYRYAEYDSTAEYDGIGQPVKQINVEGSGNSMSMKFATFDTNPSHHIQGYVLEYRVGDRR